MIVIVRHGVREQGIRSEVWNIIDFSSCLFLVCDVCSGIGLLAMHILIFISRHGIKPIKAEKQRDSHRCCIIATSKTYQGRGDSRLTPGLASGDGGWGCLSRGRAGSSDWAREAGLRLRLIMQARLHFSTQRQQPWARALPFFSIFSIFTPILAAMPRLTSSTVHTLQTFSHRLLLSTKLRTISYYKR